MELGDTLPVTSNINRWCKLPPFVNVSKSVEILSRKEVKIKRESAENAML